ncbi:MAG: dioxygenase [Proteobacteria bacterium]|nr:MAG: dioxygenase [Pseudomonadota bacterium]
MSLHRLRSLTLGVPAAALDAVRGFYRDFGLAETRPGRFDTQDGGEQLRLAEAPRRALLALEVGVDDADDLGRVAASLAKLGVACERDGASLRAVEPVTAIGVALVVEPRVAQKPPPPVAPNRPGEPVRVDARAPAVTAAAARPRRLSHVVVTSTDCAASRRFFTDGLGFRVSDEIAGIGASFMRCSTDHHNVLVQPGPFSFVHHTAWEMDDVDAVGRAAAAMVAADASRHVWGLGRHAIGSNYFWYLRDPAGTFAEYSSDLDVIADAEAWKVAASSPVNGLAAWGPPVPASFLAPEDIVALARG